jgi:hypothetical protein
MKIGLRREVRDDNGNLRGYSQEIVKVGRFPRTLKIGAAVLLTAVVYGGCMFKGEVNEIREDSSSRSEAANYFDGLAGDDGDLPLRASEGLAVVDGGVFRNPASASTDLTRGGEVLLTDNVVNTNHPLNTVERRGVDVEPFDFELDCFSFTQDASKLASGGPSAMANATVWFACDAVIRPEEWGGPTPVDMFFNIDTGGTAVFGVDSGAERELDLGSAHVVPCDSAARLFQGGINLCELGAPDEE